MRLKSAGPATRACIVDARLNPLKWKSFLYSNTVRTWPTASTPKDVKVNLISEASQNHGGARIQNVHQLLAERKGSPFVIGGAHRTRNSTDPYLVDAMRALSSMINVRRASNSSGAVSTSNNRASGPTCRPARPSSVARLPHRPPRKAHSNDIWVESRRRGAAKPTFAQLSERPPLLRLVALPAAADSR